MSPSTGITPPAPPGPVAGQPGHFASHDWLDVAVANLNERLFGGWSQNLTEQPLTNAVWTAIKYDTVLFNYGFDVAMQSGGNLLLTGNPAGYYRIDYAVGFKGNATGMRRGRFTVDGVDNQSVGVSVPSGTTTACNPTCSGIVLLPSGCVIGGEAYQNSGGNLNTNLYNQNHVFIEYLGVGSDPAAMQAALDALAAAVGTENPETG